MAEETQNTDIDLDKIEEDIEKKNKVEDRIRDLSNKVKLTAEERDELKAKTEELAAQNEALQKEKEFLSSFNDVTAKFPDAGEFQEQILEKVKAGYTAEDAALSVLNAEGKLIPGEAPKPENPAGGSADNVPTGEPKDISQMSQEERLAELQRIEAGQ